MSKPSTSAATVVRASKTAKAIPADSVWAAVISKAAKTSKAAVKGAKATKPAKVADKSAKPVPVAAKAAGYGELALPLNAKLKRGPVAVEGVVRSGTFRAALMLAVASADTVAQALASKLPAPYADRAVGPLDVRFALANGFAQFVNPEKAQLDALELVKAKLAKGKRQAEEAL